MRRLGRFEALDKRPVNLDGFAERDDEAGLVAFASANDPEPSVALDACGRVSELDGTPADDFDLIDAFVAARGIDAAVAEEANALDDVAFARLIVDPATTRAAVVRLAAGATPEKLARVVAVLRPVELQMAISKMRVRRTPSNQAHVTNRLDDPRCSPPTRPTRSLAASRGRDHRTRDADAPLNALAVLIGSQVGRAGVLTQCRSRRPLELDLGLRGLTTYAETLSLYGTEQVFSTATTPLVESFSVLRLRLAGVKMRFTSGGGSEALMGAPRAARCSILEARCLALVRAAGAQGVQNGGSTARASSAALPDGMREVLAENLLVMLRDLEVLRQRRPRLRSDIAAPRTPSCCSLPAPTSSSAASAPSRATTTCSAPSNFNADDLDDYLVLQRDWGVDGALRPVNEEQLRFVRERAARACLAVYRQLGLVAAPAGSAAATASLTPIGFTDDHVAEVVHSEGSKDVTPPDPQAILAASDAIMERRLGILDVVRALWTTGYEEEAGRVLAMGGAGVAGDYLQTAAIFDEQMNCLSKVTDPNDYQGPGTGYEVPAARREEIAAIRQQRSRADLLARHAAGAPRTDDSPAVPAARRRRTVCPRARRRG